MQHLRKKLKNERIALPRSLIVKRQKSFSPEYIYRFLMEQPRKRKPTFEHILKAECQRIAHHYYLEEQQVFEEQIKFIVEQTKQTVEWLKARKKQKKELMAG